MDPTRLAWCRRYRSTRRSPTRAADPILIAVSVLARKHLERTQAVPAQRDQ
ncbi:hypothetical protein [Saccharothrix stipae]